ncbi:OmpA family protein [Flavobacteriaceae bacterium]|nr:OmpA family protein [Flavobacteriaceae bacterium]MDB4280334.1 OmpA family protein [Flavobacteriaceae bacterium]
MKNFLIAFFTFVLWSFFALWVYFMMLPNEQEIAISKNVSPKEVVINTSVATETSDVSPTTVIPQENNQPITTQELIDIEVLPEPLPASGLTARGSDNNIVFVFEKGISFIKNTSNLIIPLSLNAFKNLIKDYLIQYPQKEVHIVSSYSATENFVSPNIGKQRGIQIKKMLIQTGINSSRIVVKSNIQDITFSSDNSYSNAIAFEFKPLDKKRIASIAPKAIKIPKSITFYPTFSNTTILKTKKLQELVARVTNILNSNPSTKVTLIGHTDNAKTSEENYTLGLSYANQIKWYLTAEGAIETKKIRIKSKGQTQPLKSNRTKKGSLANKRIVLQFK